MFARHSEKKTTQTDRTMESKYAVKRLKHCLILNLNTATRNLCRQVWWNILAVLGANTSQVGRECTLDWWTAPGGSIGTAIREGGRTLFSLWSPGNFGRSRREMLSQCRIHSDPGVVDHQASRKPMDRRGGRKLRLPSSRVVA